MAYSFVLLTTETVRGLRIMKLKQDQIVPVEHDDGRSYDLILPGEIRRVPSVRTVMQVIEKPALVPWACGVGVEEAFMLLQDEAHHNIESVKSRLKELDRTQDSRKRQGGDSGAPIHDCLLALSNGGEPSVEQQYKPYLDTLLEWVADYRPEFPTVEQNVA